MSKQIILAGRSEERRREPRSTLQIETRTVSFVAVQLSGPMKRAGSHALSLLAAPLNVHILKALKEGPKGLIDLRRAVGSPPQSTMRLYSRTLSELGVLERRRRNDFPGSSEYLITPSGLALLRIGDILQEWLERSPEGPILLGSIAAKSATKALIEGWSTNVVRALAARPLSLTELNRLIPKISYPSLERRLSAMRLANQVKPQPGDGRGTPYAVTEWLRRSVIPVAAAAGWERKFLPELTAPIGRLDVEAAFLLAVPLLDLPDDTTGKCRLAVEVQGGPSPAFAGVVVRVQEGQVTFCSSRLQEKAESWAAGTPLAWLRSMNGGADGLEMGGEVSLAEKIAEALRATATASLPPGSKDLI